MVTTVEWRDHLTTDGWTNVSVSAACANRPRDVPGSTDSFTVQRSPQQAELARLMPILDKARVPYAVRQAAVWIVTDNANYDDLGILVSRSQSLTRPITKLSPNTTGASAAPREPATPSAPNPEAETRPKTSSGCTAR
jgi:hypothetical protein